MFDRLEAAVGSGHPTVEEEACGRTVRLRALRGVFVAAVAATVAAPPMLVAAPSYSVQADVSDARRAVSAAERVVKPLPTEASLRRVIARIRETGAVGVTAEIEKGDQSWTFDAGKSSRSPAQPIKPRSRFRAASVSKQLISVLALQLVESTLR